MPVKYWLWYIDNVLWFIYCNFSNVDKIKNGRITPGNVQDVLFKENPVLGMFGVTNIPNTEF
jgi:hypothetical protein